MRQNKQPQNKELERTRSTQTAVGPRRSIQCSTGTRWRQHHDREDLHG